MNWKDYINGVVGKPWKNRTIGPDEFDCYGLMHHAMKIMNGVLIPFPVGYFEREPIQEIGCDNEVSWQECDRENAETFACYNDKGEMVHVGMITPFGYLHALGMHGNGQVYIHNERTFKKMVSLTISKQHTIRFFRWP